MYINIFNIYLAKYSLTFIYMLALLFNLFRLKIISMFIIQYGKLAKYSRSL